MMCSVRSADWTSTPLLITSSFEEWSHTDDMAVWNEGGYVLIVDRKKDIIVSGGENVSSLEVEKILLSHPAVMEAAVVPMPDMKWGEVPKALVVLRPA